MPRSKPGQFPAAVRCAGVIVRGLVDLPAAAEAVVLHAPSPGTRSRMADEPGRQALHAAKLGVAVVDLGEEAAEMDKPAFNFALVAARLLAVLSWLRDQTQDRLPLGLMSEGAAVTPALLAAAEQPARLAGLVAVGGRPDLAGAALRYVAAPTLLIVGSESETELGAHQRAFNELGGVKSLEIILGAGEHVAAASVRTVARSAAGWLAEQLCPAEVR